MSAEPLEATFTLHDLERIIAAERERERAACEAIARGVEATIDADAWATAEKIADAIAARKKP